MRFTENKSNKSYKFNNGMVLRGNARMIRAKKRLKSRNFSQRRILGGIDCYLLLPVNVCFQLETFKGLWVIQFLQSYFLENG